MSQRELAQPAGAKKFAQPLNRLNYQAPCSMGPAAGDGGRGGGKDAIFTAPAYANEARVFRLGCVPATRASLRLVMVRYPSTAPMPCGPMAAATPSRRPRHVSHPSKGRYGVPILTRIYNYLPTDHTANGGFGRNEHPSSLSKRVSGASSCCLLASTRNAIAPACCRRSPPSMRASPPSPAAPLTSQRRRSSSEPFTIGGNARRRVQL
jgi:hypothetical protein